MCKRRLRRQRPELQHSDQQVRERAQALKPDERHAAGVLNAYYQRSVAAPDLARARAQASFTITAAVAAVVLAALTQSTDASAEWEILAPLLFAAAAWMVTAWLFLRSAAGSFESSTLVRDIRSDEAEQAGLLLAELEQDRQSLEKSLRSAHVAAVIAVSLSALTGAILLVHSRTADWVPAELRFTRVAQAQIEKLCPGGPAGPWTVKEDSVSTPVLELRSRGCPGQKIMVPREHAPAMAVSGP